MSKPTKSVTKVLDAPISEVWAIISAWGSEKLWFPNVVKSSVEGFGIGAVRTLTFAPGQFSVAERLEVADPNTHTISYLLLQDNENFRGSRGTLTLKALGEGKTEFTWSGRSDWVAPDFEPELARILEEMFSNAIESVSKVLSGA